MEDEEEFFEEEEDFDDDYEIIRAKWTMDGATTLVQCAAQLRDYADYVEGLAKDGWELTEPVRDDYGFIRQDVVSPEVLA